MFSLAQNIRPRSGLSIIEVLTSIVVAMIGVFGVMALIPFATQQAQSGLDQDAATVMARNAYAQFEATGYRNNSRWVTDPGTGLQPVGALAPAVFSIDPLGITENGNNYTLTSFPFHPVSIGTAYPANLVIRPANLLTPDGNPMTTALARRMFRPSDRLIFGDSVESAPGADDSDLTGPTQLFDQAGGNPMRRQTVARLSWSAIVIPEGPGGLPQPVKYRMAMLVYKDRMTDLNAPNPVTPTDPDPRMATALVATPTGPASPVSAVTLEAGTTISSNQIHKNDWVMLIKQNPSIAGGKQIGFYRVVNFSEGGGAASATLSLDGPDFDFSNPGNNTPTYMVHLKNVIGVYEKTFGPEGFSEWNLTF